MLICLFTQRFAAFAHLPQGRQWCGGRNNLSDFCIFRTGDDDDMRTKHHYRPFAHPFTPSQGRMLGGSYFKPQLPGWNFHTHLGTSKRGFYIGGWKLIFLLAKYTNRAPSVQCKQWGTSIAFGRNVASAMIRQLHFEGV